MATACYRNRRVTHFLVEYHSLVWMACPLNLIRMLS